MTDTQTEQRSGDGFVSPETLGQEGVEGFLSTFTASGQPDIPSIDQPGPGQVNLSYGVEVGGERRTLASVRELTGADEEAIAKLDRRRDNYIPLLQDKILQRAVVDIGGRQVGPDELGQLLLGDRDKLFFEILMLTFGETKEYEGVECPHCDTPADYEITIRGMVTFKESEISSPTTTVLLRDGREVVVGYPVGEDLLAVYSKDKDTSAADRNTIMLGRCIESVNGEPPRPNGHSFARDLGVADRRIIIKAMDSAPAMEFKEVEVSCETCGQSRPIILGWADLLFL